jgi:hypothetical protein
VTNPAAEYQVIQKQSASGKIRGALVKYYYDFQTLEEFIIASTLSLFIYSVQPPI